MAQLCEFFGGRTLHKVFRRFDQFSRSYKLQSFQFDLSDATPASVEKNSPLLLNFLVDFMENLIQVFIVFLTIFHEPIKLRSFQSLEP